jgi:hypothetical protein
MSVDRVTADKTMPTPGRWYYKHDKYEGDAIIADGPRWVVRRVEDPDTGYDIVSIPNEADAKLIAAAGTAAHECAEMGYTDAVALFQALPELLEAARRLDVDARLTGLQHDAGWDTFFADLRAALARAAGKEGAE